MNPRETGNQSREAKIRVLWEKWLFLAAWLHFSAQFEAELQLFFFSTKSPNQGLNQCSHLSYIVSIWSS